MQSQLSVGFCLSVGLLCQKSLTWLFLSLPCKPTDWHDSIVCLLFHSSNYLDGLVVSLISMRGPNFNVILIYFVLFYILLHPFPFFYLSI